MKTWKKRVYRWHSTMPSKLQSHFKFGKLSTTYHRPRRDVNEREDFYVEDSRGVKSKATSNEYYVSQALDELGIEYYFQLSIDGGRQMAFGLVLDFLLMTVPFPTPLWVHGDYWHTGPRRAKDIRQMQIVDDYMKGQVNPGIEVWGGDSGNKEMAANFLRTKGLV
jgi:hypothetical protein